MNATAAASPATPGEDVPEQFLSFALGRELYALGIRWVKEIIEYGQLTVVPLMPPCTRGVINLRGAVVPVVDLASRFGRPPAAVGRRSCIVIVEIEAAAERQVMGVIVDAVNEVLEIPAARIEPPPAFGVHLRSDFIRGMARAEKGFIILLDIRRLLALDELAEISPPPDPFPDPALA